MWEWLLKQIRQGVKCVGLNRSIEGVDEDDIISLVAMRLVENPAQAERIYEEKNIMLLYTIVKREIYNQKSKMFFKDKVELSRFQRILTICEKYNIEPIAENAYKISALSDDSGSNFTISGVMTLLSMDTPIRYGYHSRGCEFTEMSEWTKRK